ncbi:MAG TPA: response regulator transcription factor [Candidatus Sulfotelmatobacter sp.]|nr:response regulator transcription factor [Candidatus Sulfotelmatobacter sp.]
MCPHAQLALDTNVAAEKKIRCLLVHDHVLIRQGLCRLLNDEEDLEVLAEAGNAPEALQRVFEHRPDVVIVDLNTFGVSAIDTERRLLQESPQSKVVFLSAYEQEDPELRSMPTDCVARQTSVKELVGMVRSAVGRRAPSVWEMPKQVRSEWDDPDNSAHRRRVLTAREREVLKLLAEGKTVRSAASALGVSAKTVDAHKFNLMRKLGIHNKAELVMWAIQRRVVKIPSNF